jgi:hypothetical protein
MAERVKGEIVQVRPNRFAPPAVRPDRITIIDAPSGPSRIVPKNPVERPKFIPPSGRVTELRPVYPKVKENPFRRLQKLINGYGNGGGQDSGSGGGGGGGGGDINLNLSSSSSHLEEYREKRELYMNTPASQAVQVEAVSRAVAAQTKYLLRTQKSPGADVRLPGAKLFLQGDVNTNGRADASIRFDSSGLNVNVHSTPGAEAHVGGSSVIQIDGGSIGSHSRLDKY